MGTHEAYNWTPDNVLSREFVGYLDKKYKIEVG